MRACQAVRVTTALLAGLAVCFSIAGIHMKPSNHEKSLEYLGVAFLMCVLSVLIHLIHTYNYFSAILFMSGAYYLVA